MDVIHKLYERTKSRSYRIDHARRAAISINAIAIIKAQAAPDCAEWLALELIANS